MSFVGYDGFVMSAPPSLSDRTSAHRAALRRRLDGLTQQFDRAYLDSDPLLFAHRYADPADQEIVGFLAASLAFGNVRAIQASVSAILVAIGPSPSQFTDRFDADTDGERLRPLYHRWIRGADLAALFVVLRAMRESSGSIGGFFMAGYDSSAPDIGTSLASFSARAKERSVPSAGSVARFFPSPADGSACKRLNLYLRWMVRGGDGLDLGLWRGVSRRQLVLPLDTHLARLSRALGLSHRRTPGWRMAIEATRSLALLDADDPIKYDFALSRLGILSLCLHGHDPLDCRRCPPPRPRSRPRVGVAGGR